MRKMRKLAAGIALVALALTIALCWPRPRGYTYQGKTPEEWWADYVVSLKRGGDGGNRAFDDAFKEMGTNALPFLAALVTRESIPSRINRIASKLPEQVRPTSRTLEEAHLAALVIASMRLPDDA